MKKIGIVAGEKSGDYLGAELVKAIKIKYPDAEFIGLAGPLMQEQGVRSLAEMEKISIMGIVGVLKGLFEILSIRRTIRKHMLAWKPDVFIGIDVPDFNLGLEIKLKEQGIPTVHYVSPTVWAWRGHRIHKIKRAINLMLTLFPFEERYYHSHNTPVKFVGHPLAEPVQNWEISAEAQEKIGADANKRSIALLPGSRSSEVTRLAPIMFRVAEILSKKYDDIEFVVPAANQKLFNFMNDLQRETVSNDAPFKIILGYSREVLAGCYCTVLASGTAALEAGMFAKPMVVMYKVAKLEEMYAKRSMEVEHFSMPNHLVSPPPVPELIQDNATDENLIKHLERLLIDADYYLGMQKELSTITPSLSVDTAQLTVEALENLLKEEQAVC